MATAMTDLYKLLGVRRNASPAKIVSAYRLASKRAHPDMPGGSHEAFMQLKIARDVLLDPELREHYDKTGEVKTRPPDQHRQHIIEYIAGIMDMTITEGLKQGMEIKFVDLMRSLKASMTTNRQNTKDQIGQFEKKKVQYQQIFERVSRTDDGENALGLIAKSQIERIDDQIRNLTKAVQIAEDALKEIASYRFRTEVRRHVTTMIDLYGAGTSTW